ncbi:MAG: nuclear transport factor 2 family protein [Betaproteobacteria bacterium]
MNTIQALDRSRRYREIADWFEQLSPQTLNNIEQIYAPSTRFIDPFNDLNGCCDTRRVFQHMFDTLDAPRFVVKRIASNGSSGFMTWDFYFSLKGRAQSISGCTEFELNDEGLIVLHRDYWDAAAQVYEQIPVLGAIVRYLRRKLALPSS